MTMPDEVFIGRTEPNTSGVRNPTVLNYSDGRNVSYTRTDIVTALKAERDALLDRVELLSMSNFAKNIQHKDGVIADQERDKDRLKAQNERLIRMLAEQEMLMLGFEKSFCGEMRFYEEQVEAISLRIKTEIETQAAEPTNER